MPVITLPDGSQRSFDNAISIHDVAADIGPGLAKAALAGKIDGELLDTSYLIENDVDLAIVTDKSNEALEIIRHSTAHLLAQAVKQLFPSAQVTIGPVIENGFFYDFAFERAFTPEDLDAITGRMKVLAESDDKVVRRVLSRDEAVGYFRHLGENYKAEIIEDIPSDQELSLYRQGEFEDLCRGPHVPSTGRLKYFKLMKVAGAYWRGDSNNEMLQRIYGTAWTSKKELKAHLFQLEEAEKRDHRKLAKKFNLFHMQEEAPGMVFWHPKGWSVYTEVERYMREVQRNNGYREIKTPLVVDRTLWERSGHWDKFRENMFTVESESRDYAVKPMNCPCHIQVYNQGLKSYRDLPLRLAEFGSCHRNEASGTLHGLMRVRGFVQDDAHIFCTEAQVQNEVSVFSDLLFDVYRTSVLKMSLFVYQLGQKSVWVAMRFGIKPRRHLLMLWWRKGWTMSYFLVRGRSTAPKSNIHLKDCLGRVWQLGTIQVDFSMPGRLDAQYVAEDGSPVRCR